MTDFSQEEKKIFPENYAVAVASSAKSYPLKNAKSHKTEGFEQTHYFLGLQNRRFSHAYDTVTVRVPTNSVSSLGSPVKYT